MTREGAFFTACHEKVARTCHSERSEESEVGHASRLVEPDASLPLSMTREGAFFTACHEKVARTCHSERSEESEVGHASRLVEPDASLPLSMTREGAFFTACRMLAPRHRSTAQATRKGWPYSIRAARAPPQAVVYSRATPCGWPAVPGRIRGIRQASRGSQHTACYDSIRVISYYGSPFFP
jgi:hypothetical protein